MLSVDQKKGIRRETNKIEKRFCIHSFFGFHYLFIHTLVVEARKRHFDKRDRYAFSIAHAGRIKIWSASLMLPTLPYSLKAGFSKPRPALQFYTAARCPTTCCRPSDDFNRVRIVRPHRAPLKYMKSMVPSTQGIALFLHSRIGRWHV